MLWTCGYGISPDIAMRTSTPRTRCSTGTRALPPQVYAATNWNYLTSNQGIIDAVPPKVVEEAALDSLFTLRERDPGEPARRP